MEQSTDRANSVSPALTAFTRGLAVATAMLIFVGAAVTTTGSGLAVPDWPLSFGTLFPSMTGGVFFEHGHRLVAGTVGFLTLILACWTALSPTPSLVRRLAWLALLLVIIQGMLGGLTVLLKLPTQVSVAHGCLAQFFLCTVVALVLVTSPSWNRPGPLDRSRVGRLRTGAFLALLAVVGQLVVGATMRHMGAGLIFVDFPTCGGAWIPVLDTPEKAIHFSHRVGALLVTIACGYLVYQILRFQKDSRLRGLAWAIIGLLSLQVILGVTTLFTMRGFYPTCLHVMNGAVLLATVFSTVIWALRLPVVDSQTAPEAENRRGTVKDWVELTKPRLVTMAAFTAGCSYWMATDHPAWLVLTQLVLGTYVMGSGAAVLNHVLEMDVDAQMRRTQNRPLPAGRLNPAVAELLGGVMAAGGCLYLGLAVQPLSGLLAALAVISYVLVYTPMKRKTPMCTLVGAIPGALPVLVGWAGANGTVTIGGWLLFLILFLWQLPHFMGIAWLCREDYARARLPMITVVDPEGFLASAQIIVYTLLLVPVSMAPTLAGMAGVTYFVLAFLLGMAFLFFGVRMARERTTRRARQLVLASVTYLPLLYILLLWNRT